MARRTKEDALVTRSLILDAAERVFQRRGVSRTSLQEIAQEADLTRGAIYWHFQNKGEVFNAMLDRVTLPMEASFKDPPGTTIDNPLEQVRLSFANAFQKTVHDPQVRRVFEELGHLSKRMTPSAAATGLYALISGLLQNWLLDPKAFDLEVVGAQTLEVYLAGLAVSKR